MVRVSGFCFCEFIIEAKSIEASYKWQPFKRDTPKKDAYLSALCELLTSRSFCAFGSSVPVLLGVFLLLLSVPYASD